VHTAGGPGAAAHRALVIRPAISAQGKAAGPKCSTEMTGAAAFQLAWWSPNTASARPYHARNLREELFGEITRTSCDYEGPRSLRWTAASGWSTGAIEIDRLREPYGDGKSCAERRTP